MNAITPIGEIAKRIVAGCAAARERRWRIESQVAALRRIKTLPDDIADDLDTVERDIVAGTDINPSAEAGVKALYFVNFGEWVP